MQKKYFLLFTTIFFTFGLQAEFDFSNYHILGLKGKGVKIAILDKGFKDYEKYLPDALYIDPAKIPASDSMHGTNVARIIKDIAPESEIILCNANGFSNFSICAAAIKEFTPNIVYYPNNWLYGNLDGKGFINRVIDDSTSTGTTWVVPAGDFREVLYSDVSIDRNGNGITEFQNGSSENLPVINNFEGPIKLTITWNEWDDISSKSNALTELNLILTDLYGNIVAKAEKVKADSTNPYKVLTIKEPLTARSYFLKVTTNNPNPVEYRIYAEGLQVSDLFKRSPFSLRKLDDNSVLVPGDNVNVLTIGGVDQFNNLTLTSGTGDLRMKKVKPDFVAPSFYPLIEDLADFEGTSISSAIASGKIALVLSNDKLEMTKDELMSILIFNAQDLGIAGPDTAYGYGLLTLPYIE